MTKTSGLSLADAGADSRTSSLAYDSIDQAFPEVDPGFIPFGSRVLVQIRTPMLTTRGGIVVPDGLLSVARNTAATDGRSRFLILLTRPCSWYSTIWTWQVRYQRTMSLKQ